MGTARLYAWSRRRPVLLDGILAGTLFLTLGLLSAVVAGWGGLLFGMLLTLPLAVRRRWPEAVFASTVVVSLLQVVLLSQPLPADAVPPFVLYTVAAHVGRQWVRWAAVAAGALACVLGPWRWTAAAGGVRGAVGLGVGLAVFLAVLWLLGDLVRAREGTMARLRDANEALARDREQRDQLVAQRERLAVARDVHDVVAHSLSVVVVQADGASYAAEHADHWSRDEAVAALTAIGRTARGALAETRRVVGVLREDDPDAMPAPTPGLGDIDRLVAAVRAAGVRVDSTVPATAPDDVAAEVQLAAYRVVQEGLTNVLKHAGADARGEVLVERVPGGLRVTVADDGLGGGAASSTGPGSGLAGMRERVAATGGHLVAGPRTRGGYAVTATLPLARVGGGPA
jgi:signal transduction histidine kinase